MKMRFTRHSAAALLLFSAVVARSSTDKTHQQGQELTPQQSALVDQMEAHEQQVVDELAKRAPVIETYVQGTKPDSYLREVPSGDEYLLSRVVLGKNVSGGTFNVVVRSKSIKRNYLSSSDSVMSINHLLGTKEGDGGYVSMLVPSSTGHFGRKDIDVTYIGRQFLGQIRTSIFFVRSKDHKGFLGQIWVDEQEGFLVHFSGSFESQRQYHIESWRTNVQPGLWLPSYVYIEDASATGADHHHFHGQSRLWGYSLKVPNELGDSESVKVDAVNDTSDQSTDLSPLEAKRQFEQQAQTNVENRLYQAGLLAAPSDFDKVLETVTNNLIIGAKLQVPDIHCRVLLTEPLESLTIGNTIVLSKGIVDTLPTEEDLAMVLAFQLAHIALGHEVQTRYGFSDALFFNDTDAYNHIPLGHTDEDNRAAARKAIDILSRSVYAPKVPQAALYLNQLFLRSKPLQALVHPRLGDGFFTNDNLDQMWLQQLLVYSPRINMADLSQIAALPLNSQLKVNAWDDTVQQLVVKQVAFQTPADKMPLELTPIVLRLTRYAPPADPTVAAGTPPASTPPSNTVQKQ